MNSKSETYTGKYYCGGCSVSATGKPMIMAYCHCHSCRKWHSAPVNAWCLCPETDVSFAGSTLQSDKSDESHRVSCGKCGGALAKIKPRQDVVAIYAMSVADTDLCFEPALHIFYGERVLDMADGLPKWDTVPAAWGGNGIELPEPTGTGWRSRYPQVDR